MNVITCPTCGLQFDPSDLANVVAHKHNTEFMIEKGKYMGERHESKARFFAQYFGQRVCYVNAVSYIVAAGDVNESTLRVPNLYILLLHSIEDITDEQKIQVAKLSGVDYKTALDRAISFDTALPDKTERDFLLRTYRFYIKQSDLNYKAYQYLLSQSSALDWYCHELNRVITVPEQIELGWIRLIEKT